MNMPTGRFVFPAHVGGSGFGMTTTCLYESDVARLAVSLSCKGGDKNVANLTLQYTCNTAVSSLFLVCLREIDTDPRSLGRILRHGIGPFPVLEATVTIISATLTQPHDSLQGLTNATGSTTERDFGIGAYRA